MNPMPQDLRTMLEDEFRGSGNVLPPQKEDVSEDWNTLKGWPRYLYLVYRGYGVDDMELWRVLCVGEEKTFAKTDHATDHWRYQNDRCLWSSEKITVVRDSISTFRMRKDSFDASLEAALKHFDLVRKVHLQAQKDNIKSIEANIKSIEAERDRLVKKAQKDKDWGPQWLADWARTKNDVR